MSDIAIPGVNSRFNTKQMVEDLVKVERTKLDAIKNDAKKLEDQKKIWQNYNRLLTTLRTTARSLYSFDNPFAERSAQSSHAAVSARATREAAEGTTRLEVIRLSQADRFSSGPIAKDQQVPDGTYTFLVGDNRISYRYHGGKIGDFVAGLNRRGEGTLKASLIQNKPDSQILLVESLKTGSKYPLRLEDAAKDLGLQLGLIAESRQSAYEANLAPSTIQGLSGPVRENLAYQLQDQALTVKPGNQLRLELPGLPALTPAMVLEYEVRAFTPPEAASQPAVPKGPSIPGGPSATVKGFTLPGFASVAPLPEWKPPEKPPVKIDDQMLWLAGASSEKALAAVPDSEAFQKVTVALGQEYPGLKNMVVRNNNSHRELQLRNIVIRDPAARGDYRPAHPVSTAQDALIRLEGIDIEREKNVISDAIPGVTLTLNDVSKEKIAVKVEPDRKLVKEKLIEFVAQYNAVIREANILTARQGTTDIVDEIDFFTDDERTKALEQVGQFQGDSTLNMVKSRLQTIMANAYTTGKPGELVLLNKAGISTNASGGGAGGGVQTSKLRGYIEIDEKKLDKVLEENFLGVKDLFGIDSDGDLIADRGVGVELEKYIQPYVQVGGILANKSNYYDSQIKDKNAEAKKFEAYLVSYEAELKSKYGRMEGSINQVENSAKELKQLDAGKN